uniref:Uncharacterized protein n=1 Tax=Plectus sambesii TaxID=2011161 RepID=A0A914UQ67_9BILA
MVQATSHQPGIPPPSSASTSRVLTDVVRSLLEHSDEQANDEGVAQRVVAKVCKVLHNVVVLADLFGAGDGKRRAAVFQRYGDVNYGGHLLSFIDNHQVWPQVYVAAQHALVSVDGGAQSHLHSFDQPVKDSVMAAGHAVEVRLAVVDDVGQSLVGLTALATSLVARSEATAAIERDHSKAGAVYKAPLGKAGKVAIPHEVVRRRCCRGDVVDLALVWLGDESLEVAVADCIAKLAFSKLSGHCSTVQHQVDIVAREMNDNHGGRKSLANKVANMATYWTATASDTAVEKQKRLHIVGDLDRKQKGRRIESDCISYGGRKAAASAPCQ